METKTLYVFEFDLNDKSICKKTVLKMRMVEVTETPKQFRATNKTEGLTNYRNVVSKTELNVLHKSRYGGRSFQMLSDCNDVSYFKEKIVEAMNEKKDKLLSEINEINNQIEIVLKENKDETC